MNKLHYLFLSFVMVLASACYDGSSEATVSMADGIQTVTAFAETEPVPDDDDAADDPYIMVTDQGKTIVAGTNKRRGVELYTLQGERIASIDSGRVNNIDGIYDTQSQSFRIAGSNRTNTQVDIYQVTIEPVTISLTTSFDLPLREPYGLCVSPDYIYVGDKEGTVQAWTWDGQGPVRTFDFKSQTEGCVVDTRNNDLYVGEEMAGIWRVDLDGDAPDILFAATDDQNLVGDVEGLDIYYGEERAVLLASSQGDSSYLAYDIENAEQLAKFAIASTSDNSIDGTQDTDGIAISSAAIPNYPKGLLVVQDGFNVDDREKALNQNFKLIDWRDVETLFSRAATPNQE